MYKRNAVAGTDFVEFVGKRSKNLTHQDTSEFRLFIMGCNWQLF